MGIGAGQFAFMTRGAIAALLAAVFLTACSSQRSLLEQPGLMTDNGRPLIAPPTDVLAKADPSRATVAEDLDAPGSSVPSLEEISKAAPTFDIDQNAAALDVEQKSSPAGSSPKWKGRLTPEGLDIVNASGVLCSAPGRGSPVVVACSDGRVGTFTYLTGGTTGRVSFGAEFQAVSLAP